MESQNLNPNSHLTAKERAKMSFPARFLWERNLLQGKVLDFGCGFGVDVRELGRRNIQVTGYDKFHLPQYPVGQYDTIICLYVLNVLLPEEQLRVQSEINNLLAPGGKVYYAVRRDVRTPGFRVHKLHGKRTYQCNVSLELPSIFLNDYCEIYVGENASADILMTPKPEGDRNQIKAKLPWETTPCPFCMQQLDREIIADTAFAFAVYDRYPVAPGHALIIPKQHVSNFFELEQKVQNSCWLLLNHVQELLQQRHAPQGFTVGINVGPAAGQTIMHAHIHLIPRNQGDVSDPRGGVRKVLVR